jgi:hypothetical protein
MSALPASFDRDLQDAALAVVHGCKESDAILMVSEEARALEERYPQSGFTFQEIVDYIAAAAAERGVVFALGWEHNPA